MQGKDTTPTVTITFDADSRDYVVELDGQLVGFAPNRAAAEQIANEAVYRVISLRARDNLIMAHNAYCDAIDAQRDRATIAQSRADLEAAQALHRAAYGI